MTSRSLSRNLISQAGIVLAIVAIANTLFLIVVDASQRQPNPYIGILAWIIGPAILCFGLALYIIGILFERRRRRRRAPEEMPQYAVVDFNERRTRTIVIAST